MVCNRFQWRNIRPRARFRALNGRRGGTGNNLDGLPCRISREMEPAKQPGFRIVMGAISATRRRSNDAECDFLMPVSRGTQPFNGDDANVWTNVNRRRFLKVLGNTPVAASASSMTFGENVSAVSIAVDPADEIAGLKPVQWAVEQLVQALKARGVAVAQVAKAQYVSNGSILILAAKLHPAFTKELTNQPYFVVRSAWHHAIRLTAEMRDGVSGRFLQQRPRSLRELERISC